MPEATQDAITTMLDIVNFKRLVNSFIKRKPVQQSNARADSVKRDIQKLVDMVKNAGEGLHVYIDML